MKFSDGSFRGNTHFPKLSPQEFLQKGYETKVMFDGFYPLLATLYLIPWYPELTSFDLLELIYDRNFFRGCFKSSLLARHEG